MQILDIFLNVADPTDLELEDTKDEALRFQRKKIYA